MDRLIGALLAAYLLLFGFSWSGKGDEMNPKYWPAFVTPGGLIYINPGNVTYVGPSVGAKVGHDGNPLPTSVHFGAGSTVFVEGEPSEVAGVLEGALRHQQ